MRANSSTTHDYNKCGAQLLQPFVCEENAVPGKLL
jgi:hypothetical protein